MALEATIVDPLVDDVPGEWDHTVAAIGLSPLWGSSILARLAWCSSQRALLSLVRDGAGDPVGLFCARHVGLAPPARLRFARPHDRRRWGFLECSLLPGTSLAGHAFVPGLEPAGQAAVVDAFEHSARRRLGWSGRAVVYRQVRTSSLAAFDRPRRVVRRVMPEFAIENRWTSFDQYLRALPASVRREIERLARRVAGDARVVTAIDDDVSAAEVSRLVFTVRKRHEPRTKALPWPSAYCTELGQVDSARFLTCRDGDGRLQALALVVDDGSALRWYAWGQRDRADGGLPNLYFHCTAQLVGDLIARGAERLLMGKTMEPLKRRFGGRPVPLYVVASLR